MATKEARTKGRVVYAALDNTDGLSRFNEKCCTLESEIAPSLFQASDIMLMRARRYNADQSGQNAAGGDEEGEEEGRFEARNSFTNVNDEFDYLLLRGIWYLKYATPEQLAEFLLANKRSNAELAISEALIIGTTKKIRQRLAYLEKNGILWEHQMRFSKKELRKAFSLTSMGNALLNSYTEMVYNQHPFTTVAKASKVLDRLATNSILQQILKTGKKMDFLPPCLISYSKALDALTGGKSPLWFDYNISFDNPEKDGYSYMMIKSVPDPDSYANVMIPNELNNYYLILAYLCKEYIYKYGRRDDKACILFVCPTKRAMSKIINALKAVNGFLTSYSNDIYFTGEGALNIMRDGGVGEGLMRIEYDVTNNNTMGWVVYIPERSMV